MAKHTWETEIVTFREQQALVWIMKKWVALSVIRTVLISSSGTTPTAYLVGMLLFIMKAKSDSISKGRDEKKQQPNSLLAREPHIQDLVSKQNKKTFSSESFCS